MSQPPEFGPRYDSTRQAWENIWDTASVERELVEIDYARSQKTIQTYLPYLNKDGIHLEAGSGLNAVVITLRKLGYNIVGLDYAEKALHTSHAYDHTLPLLVGDVHALPHATNSLDSYLSFGVLEHFEHGMSPALAEAFRVLKPGGVLVLTIPYPNLVNRYVAWRRRTQGVTVLNDDDFYESTYTRDALVQNVTGVGFKLETVQPTSHSYTLWGIGGPFRAKGYYQTSQLAEVMGEFLGAVLPWPFNFSTLVVARKP
ncbi:MAG: class I SAM-dependent methyltransferase [Chloroflexi bacterium]|nr:class I SAM-dependent methyltransferase [Chloroflexota bacterium]MCC6893045.1 class I SAM-dependent methyltransferase [Anaerolineae bacterium]